MPSLPSTPAFGLRQGQGKATHLQLKNNHSLTTTTYTDSTCLWRKWCHVQSWPQHLKQRWGHTYQGLVVFLLLLWGFLSKTKREMNSMLTAIWAFLSFNSTNVWLVAHHTAFGCQACHLWIKSAGSGCGACNWGTWQQKGLWSEIIPVSVPAHGLQQQTDCNLEDKSRSTNTAHNQIHYCQLWRGVDFNHHQMFCVNLKTYTTFIHPMVHGLETFSLNFSKQIWQLNHSPRDFNSYIKFWLSHFVAGWLGCSSLGQHLGHPQSSLDGCL